ncbi:MAG: PP2C family protein-serine/threonine phosphatase [Spirochaetales bacterium]
MWEIIGILTPGILIGFILGKLNVLWNKKYILLYKRLSSFYRSLPEALQASLYTKSGDFLPFNTLVQQWAATFTQASAVAIYLFIDDTEQSLALKGLWKEKSFEPDFPPFLSFSSLNLSAFPKDVVLSQPSLSSIETKEFTWVYLALKEKKQNLGLLLMAIPKGQPIQKAQWMPTFAEAARTLSKGIVLISDISYFAEIQMEKEKKKYLEELHSLLYNKKLPKVPALGIDSFYLPAGGINSDFMDWVSISDTKFYIVHGESTGKGYNAILTSLIIKVVLHLLAPLIKKPETIFNRLNWIFCKVLSGDFFSSLIVLHIDLAKKEISCSKAGNSGALRCSFFPKTNFESLSGGIPLGIDKTYKYQSNIYPIHSGDIWVLYSDGLVEIKSGSGEIVGLDWIQALVNEHKFSSAQNIQKIIKHQLQTHSEGKALEDDASMVILKFR